MISDNVRNEAWHAYQDISRICRYAEDHSNKYRRHNRKMMAALSVFAIVSALPSDIFPIPYIYIFPGVIAGGLALASIYLGFSDKASTLFGIYTRCSMLRNTYKVLWLKIEDGMIDNIEVLEMIETLSKEIDEATNAIGYAGIVIDEKLHLNAANKTAEILSSQYHPQHANT